MAIAIRVQVLRVWRVAAVSRRGGLTVIVHRAWGGGVRMRRATAEAIHFSLLLAGTTTSRRQRLYTGNFFGSALPLCSSSSATVLVMNRRGTEHHLIWHALVGNLS